MKKGKVSFRILLIAIAFIIAGVTTVFLVIKKDSDKKPVKGVFVQIDEAFANKGKT